MSSSNTVSYDANANPVSAVTVFQSNRAEVQRKIQVTLKEGQNDVEVKNLPTCLEESSIRVDGIGNATIFDVIYHPAPPIDYSKDFDSYPELRARQNALRSELAIYKKQEEVIAAYSKSLTSRDTNSEQLETFLDTYSSRQTRIDEKVKKLDADLEALDKEIRTGRNTSFQDDESIRTRGVRVTIIVLADGDGDAELSLTYIVASARWTPQYDLRASIASDAKTESTVGVHYRASISQRTGEDWKGVALTLSTASPLQGTNIPVLEPMWIGVKPPPAPAHSFAAEKMKRRSVVGMAMAMQPPAAPLPARPMARRRAVVESEDDDEGEAEEESRQVVRTRATEATDGAVSATFAIPGLSTIPSDSEKSQQTHKVSIAELDFSAVELEWVSVPKDVPSVFLRCKVKNTTRYVLLPGKTNVFLNGNFVAKSSIPHVSPQESFSCSLGVDPGVRVTYHPQTKKSKASGGSVLTSFSAKTSTTTFEQAITLKNTRLSRVHRLILKEQIPVSRDSTIKVNLLEPRALSTAVASTLKGKGDGLASVGKGVSVRWTRRNDSDSGGSSAQDDGTGAASANSAQGLMEWIMEMDPGASIDVNLAWEVVAPSDVQWTSMK